MLKKDPKYQRLKVGGRGLAATREYWLGPDHLLMVEVSSFNERYRRFYFRDAQGLIIQETNLRLVLNGLIWLSMLLILGVFAMATAGERMSYVSTIVLVVLELIPASLLFLNKRSGPTCKVLLRTAVQTQILGNIVRWKKAERLAIELAPHIQAAQTAYVTPPAATEAATPTAPAPAAPVELPPEAPPPPAA